jgi:hypothetical protein
MAGTGARIGLLAAGCVLGGAAGWVGGRTLGVPPAPPPSAYRNPLVDAVRGEALVHARPGDGARVVYRVLQAEAQAVLLSVETEVPGEPPLRQEIRIARSFFGPLLVLEGDVDPRAAAAGLRDFVLESATPETIAVEGTGRSYPCWRFTGSHRVQGTMTFWVSDEVPVHGVVRVDTARGRIYEIAGSSGGSADR